MNSTCEQNGCHPNSQREKLGHVSHDNSRFNRKRLSSLVRFIVLSLSFSAMPQFGNAADIHVDPILGDDAADGSTSPVKTIATAIRQACLEIRFISNPILCTVTGPHSSTNPESPGIRSLLTAMVQRWTNGDPLDPQGWIKIEPGLFRNDDRMPLTDAIIDRWFLS